jgi:hypothetical protein
MLKIKLVTGSGFFGFISGMGWIWFRNFEKHLVLVWLWSVPTEPEKKFVKKIIFPIFV